ncbi:MAG: hypothetical protein M1819_005426 [Sarea resinae]|nr:MAG: hypothetical protein M1819_005426 [Sarea resinae]
MASTANASAHARTHSPSHRTVDADGPEEEDLGPYDGHDRESLGQSFRLKALSQDEAGKSTSPPSSPLRQELLSDREDDEETKDERSMSVRRMMSASTTTINTASSMGLYTPDEERAVLWKLDRRVVLFISMLYMLSFLDRSNIGNAKIAGLSRDLKLSSAQYEWLLTGFYITYITFEWMALLYRLVPPHIYISLCVLCWGLLASFQALAASFPALLILRALLGISEAAFGPGAPFYLSFFYRREELALRTGLFISAAPLATSFASSLAWVITKLGEHGPIAPWRLLFLVEGFPSVMVAAFAWFHLPDSPATATFFNKRERDVAKLRLRKDRPVENDTEGKRGLRLREILETLKDPKCYMTAMMMGYSSLSSQALSAPPYLVAFVVVLITAFLSDRHRARSSFICFHALLAAAGYMLIAIAGWCRWPNGWRYFGIYPAAAGFFSAITIIITWTINNQESDSKKGTGIAMLNVIGQCGPLLGTRLYPASDKPLYVMGMSVCAVFMLFVFALSLGLRMVLAKNNVCRASEYERFGQQEHEGLVGASAEKRFGGPEPFEYMI